MIGYVLCLIKYNNNRYHNININAVLINYTD